MTRPLWEATRDQHHACEEHPVGAAMASGKPPMRWYSDWLYAIAPHVPEAVRGTKDAVDADGNPTYQSIDQSKLVPLMVAAIQELLGRIERLEDGV